MNHNSGTHKFDAAKTKCLPFARCQGGKIVQYWAPQPETGDWAEDNKIGRQYADDLALHWPTDELGVVLSHVVEAIAHSGRYEGIEVGFIHRIGEIAASAKEASKEERLRAA